MKPKKRKRFLTRMFMIAGLLIALVAFVGSGSKPEEEEITIKVLGWQPGGAEAWNEVADMFMQEHPNIKIEYEVVPMEGYYPKQGAYLAAKSGPDIMGNNCGFETWERKDGYIDHRSLIAEDRDAVDHLLDTTSNHLAYDKNKPSYGLSFSYQGNVWYYNKEILSNAGLDPDNPPVTWEEFDRAAKAIKKTGKAPIATGVGHTIAYWIFPEVAKNFGESEQQITDFAMGKIRWSDPVLANTLKYMADMVEREWFQEGAATINMQPDGFDFFLREEAAFTPSIISDAFHWKAVGDAIGHEKVGAMLAPSINPDTPFARKFSGVPGSSWGITPWSEHKDEAWEFIKFFISADLANMWLEMGGMQPNTSEFDASVNAYAPAFLQIQEIIKNPMVHAGVLNSGRELDELSRGYQEVMAGQLSVSDWIKRMNAALDESRLKKPDLEMWK
jgi:ABC-type glycerol-3-phosphate transport system substrate-binding protein